MNITNFILVEESPGFLDISSAPIRPLSELFTSTLDSECNWNPTSRNIHLSSSDESDEKTEFVVRSHLFEKIKSGSQENNVGEFHAGLAEDYCEALNDLSEETHVAFSKDRIVPSLTGGTCSAMSFELANDYLRKKSTLPANEIIDEITPKYTASSEYFRTIQAAFNTIHRDPKHPSDDFMRDKIGAMLRFYDRYITDASEIFDMECGSIASTKEKIESFLEKFDEGVFVIRSILFESNDKGEAYGHSTIHIKEIDKAFFYDPNEGIYELTGGLEIDSLHTLLKTLMQKWVVPYGRIYKLQ